jgi:short subunit dehydrogenase-like uncharacterized protein
VSERDLDVVVFGATGITGRNVAAYLAERAHDGGAGWAAAARDVPKLERLLDEMGVTAPEKIAADLQDADSLATMASRSRVVLNLVGPYAPSARPVIEACVTRGAHYVDLSGEIPFVRQVIDEFDSAAQAAGVKIVQVCGFEALPPDLSVLLAAETALQRWEEPLSEVDLELTMKGPTRMSRPEDLSGGTLQSMATALGRDDAVRVIDPAALVTDDSRAAQIRARSPIAIAPRLTRGGAVVAPMMPAPFINPAVIQRTAALLAREAQPFRYREGFALGGSPVSLPLRLAAAGAMAGTHAAMRALARAGPSLRRRVSAAMVSLFPASGYGPTGQRLHGWQWSMLLEARTPAGHEVRVEVDGEGHPGYLATARMLGETGLLLAEPGATPDRAGCLTPATALGTASLERFERARLRFSVA